jgi:hypothetical protein
MDHLLDSVRAEDERAFFSRRLEEERAALRATSDPGVAWRHRRLVTRYELVLSLYKGAEAA